jgi:hypothetical protein
MPLPKPLKKGAPRAKKQKVIAATMHDLKHGKHHGDRTRAQEIAIAEKQAGNSRKAPAKKKSGGKKKDGADDATLRRHSHHLAQAQKHRAHADLIEAKLKTQGKRISTDYGDGIPTRTSASMPTRKIVPDVPMG